MKKHRNFLLYSLILFNLALRYPTGSSRQKGVDALLIYIHADLVTREGNVPWILDIKSWIGIYPFSQETGVPLILSASSSISSLDIEISMLIYSMLFSILGTLSVFLLSRALMSSYIAQFITISVYSLSPIFIYYTDWNLGSRSVVISLLPLLIFLYLRYQNDLKSDVKFLLLFLMTALCMITSHNLFLFVPLVFFSLLVLGLRTSKNKEKIDHYIRKIKNPKIYFPLIFLMLLLPLNNIGRVPSFETLENGVLISGDYSHVRLFNLFITYGFSVGALLPLSFFGLYLLSKSKKNSVSENFLLLVILTNTPFLFDTVYFKSFFFVFPILLIGYSIDSFAFSSLFNNKSSQSSIFVMFLLFFLILLPSCIDFDDEGDLLLFNRNNETKNFSDMRNYDYDTAQSMRYNFEGIHIATNKEKVLGAYSGGQTLFDWNTDMFIHSNIPPDQIEIERFVSLTEVSEIIDYQGKLWAADDWTTPEKDKYWSSKFTVKMFFRDVYDVSLKRAIYSTYDVEYYVTEDNFEPPSLERYNINKHAYYNSITNGPFYKVYCNNNNIIYYIKF